MTMAPSLRLETSFITDVNVEANPEFKKEASGDDGVSVDTKLVILGDPNQLDRFQLQLRVWTEESDEPVAPYDVDVQIVARIAIDEAEDFDDGAHKAAYGVSILYSQLREHVLLITGRGPWGAWHLPTLNPKAMMEDAFVHEVDFGEVERKIRENEGQERA